MKEETDKEIAYNIFQNALRMAKEKKGMRKEIIKICKEIKRAKDTKKIMFPLIFKLSLLKAKYGKDFIDLVLKNTEINRIWDKTAQKVSKYIIGNTPLTKEWEKYKNKKLVEYGKRND